MSSTSELSRCPYSICRPESTNPHPLAALQGKLNLSKILKSKTSLDHTHIIAFSDLRAEVRNELECAEEVAGVKVVSRSFMYRNYAVTS